MLIEWPFFMSGSVSLSIEAQRLVNERTSNAASDKSSSIQPEQPSSSAIQSRSSSDYTVTLSEDSQSLLNDERQSEAQDADITNDEVDRSSSAQDSEDVSANELTEEEQQEVEELEARDEEVRVHEQAHASVGGQYAGSPSYSYEQGPDGKRYITDGEVQIDVSPITNDPQATIEKMKQVYRAALAPAEPSAADRSVASEAQQQIAEATAELAQPSQSNETNETYQSSSNRSTLEINSFYSKTNSTRGAQINLTA